MRKLQLSELILLLKCPDCGGHIDTVDGKVICSSCMTRFNLFHDQLILLQKDNELFPVSVYADSNVLPVSNRRRRRSVIKRFIPKKSINLARKKMFDRLAKEHNEKDKVILVVGCGNQTAELEKYFSGNNAVFVFCDIDKHADVDIFCDSHKLPFLDGSFDGIISTAVMEHVLYPEKVIEEMSRVLKFGGFIYSEIPFLQSVHEGAYDFTRFTMSGHRRLLENFKEIDSGMVAGPGTALVWGICDFFGALSTNSRISFILVAFARVMFSWIKYFDYLIKNNQSAINAASCTYFYGKKTIDGTTVTEIINKYNGPRTKHV